MLALSWSLNEVPSRVCSREGTFALVSAVRLLLIVNRDVRDLLSLRIRSVSRNGAHLAVV